MKKRIWTAVGLLLLLTACGGPAAEETPAPEPTPTQTAEPTPPPESTPTQTAAPTPTPEVTIDPVTEQVAAMTEEELAGQLLVVGLEGTAPGDDAREAIEELHVGGVILFPKNVENASQLAAFTNSLKELNRAAGNVPLFLCVDEEGGSVSRMPPEVTDLPAAFDGPYGGIRGEVLATECKAFGFNLDFAPVLDVWSNPDNTVIGKRAFHTDPLEVTISSTGCAYAMMDAGVIPAVKHFPGHGDTDADSHESLPVVDKTRQELEDTELMPFRFAVEGGSWKAQKHDPVPAVMVGHILLKQIAPQLPASLSPQVVDGLLRRELGFDGVVFTDDLTMGAVSQNYDISEAVVLSLQAGCDMALVCHEEENARAAHAAILAALKEGTLTRERLEESVCRILSLKAAYGVDDVPVEEPDVEELNRLIATALAS